MDAPQSPSESPSESHYLPKAFLLALVVSGLCAWPAQAWGGREGLVTLGIAAAIALFGATVAHAVGRLMARMGTGPDASAQGSQAAITVRMFLTLAVSLPIFIWEPVPAMQFAAWLGAHYLSQMALEVLVSVRELSQNHGPTGTPARTSQPEVDSPETVDSLPPEPSLSDAGSPTESVSDDAREGERE